MRTFIYLTVTVTFLLAVRGAYAQAAAEAVLLHGNAATATTKAGSALGNAINKAAGQVNNKIETTTQRSTTQRAPVAAGMSFQVERTPISQRASAAQHGTQAQTSSTTARSSMIVSMQGGSVTRSTPRPAPAKPSGAPQSETAK